MSAFCRCLINNNLMGMRMSVTAVARDFDLSNYDYPLLHIWGPWMRQNGGDGAGLGYPKTSVLSSAHGLGGGYDPDMPEDVVLIDEAVRSLPPVCQEVAREWYVYHRCKNKASACRAITVWFAEQGRSKTVDVKAFDLWLSAVTMSVYGGWVERESER